MMDDETACGLNGSIWLTHVSYNERVCVCVLQLTGMERNKESIPQERGRSVRVVLEGRTLHSRGDSTPQDTTRPDKHKQPGHNIVMGQLAVGLP